MEIIPYYLDGSGDILVITFNEMWNDHRGARFWGERPLKTLGLPAWGITTNAASWYPAAETLLALREPLTVARKFKHVVLYGYSMGAYAAIKYSSLFSDPIVLAFSPQWSINPIDCEGKDSRYEEFFDPQTLADMAIRPQEIGGRVIVFYDPLFSEDAFHVSKINYDVIEIPMERCGHETIQCMSSSNILGYIINEAIYENYDTIKRIARKNARKSVTYIRSNLINIYETRRNKIGIKYIGYINKFIENDSWSQLIAGSIYRDSGMYVEAISAFNKAYHMEQKQDTLKLIIETQGAFLASLQALLQEGPK